MLSSEALFSSDPIVWFDVRGRGDAKRLIENLIPPERWRVRLEHIVGAPDWTTDLAGGWADCGFDAFAQLRRRPDQLAAPAEASNDFSAFRVFRDSGIGKLVLDSLASRRKPNAPVVASALGAMLDEVERVRPRRLTVPQVPLNKKGDASAAKINRVLAEACSRHVARWSPVPELVLPLVLESTDPISTVKGREKVVGELRDLVGACGASAAWLVDASLDDHAVKQTMDKQIKNLIELHRAARRTAAQHLRMIAGPYWLLQYVLYARDLADEPLSAASNPFTFSFTRPPRSSGPARVLVPLPMLHRYAEQTAELDAWLRDAADRIGHDEWAGRLLRQVADRFAGVVNPERAKKMAKDGQLTYYLAIGGELADVDPAGRPLRMFELMANAVRRGSMIRTELPKGAGNNETQRKPGAVAQSLMLHCLPQ